MDPPPVWLADMLQDVLFGDKINHFAPNVCLTSPLSLPVNLKGFELLTHGAFSPVATPLRK